MVPDDIVAWIILGLASFGGYHVVVPVPTPAFPSPGLTCTCECHNSLLVTAVLLGFGLGAALVLLIGAVVWLARRGQEARIGYKARTP